MIILVLVSTNNSLQNILYPSNDIIPTTKTHHGAARNILPPAVARQRRTSVPLQYHLSVGSHGSVSWLDLRDERSKRPNRDLLLLRRLNEPLPDLPAEDVPA